MNWELREIDRQLWERELASFVPPRVFDAHAHLYDVAHFSNPAPALCAAGPPRAGRQQFQQHLDDLLPARTRGGLFFGFPAVGVDTAAANRFVAEEVQADPLSRAQMLITPEMDADLVREEVRRGKFAGLKCYHLFATHQPTFEAEIGEFLTPAHMQVAHELGLTVTLHIVRSRALADSSNQEVLCDYAHRFPQARLILAHAGRGFNPHHTLQGISALRGLENTWFDTSAVTDSGALEAIVRTLGHERLLYGSDFPVSHLRGRCVALGDSFLWLTPENTDTRAPYGPVEMALVGLEALRTLKVAARSLALTDAQVEDVFYENAARLFSLPPA